MTKKVKPMQKMIRVIPTGETPLCPACHQPLTRIVWNDAVDLLLCQNLDCVLAKKPQGSVTLAGNVTL